MPPKQIQIWAWLNGLYGSFRSHFPTQYDRKCFFRYSRHGYFWHLFTPLWVKENVCFLSRPRPERPEVTPKSAIYTRKWDEEHHSHFYMGVPLKTSQLTSSAKIKTGVCAIQDYSYHKDLMSTSAMKSWFFIGCCLLYFAVKNFEFLPLFLDPL